MAPIRVLATGMGTPSSPALRIRVGLYQEPLRRHGVELDLRSLFRDSDQFYGARHDRRTITLLRARRRLRRELLIADDQADVTLIQRQADPFALRSLDRLAIDGRPLIYDVDDAIWTETQLRASSSFAILKGSGSKARWLAERARYAIAANDVIAEWLSNYAEDVRVIPSVVDAHSFQRRHHEPASTIVLAWVGSHSTAAHLQRLAGPLKAAAAAVKPLALDTIAVGASPQAARGLPIRTIPWSKAAEREALTSADIGLMPLADNPWNRAKSAHKAVLYMAAGLPVIADDVGAARAVIGNAGLVVRDEAEWTSALIELIRDVSIRANLGRVGAQRARDLFSVRTWAPELAALVTSCT